MPFSVSVATQAGSLASGRNAPRWREAVFRRRPLRRTAVVWVILGLAMLAVCGLARRRWPWGTLRVAATSLAVVALITLAGCIGSSATTPTPTVGTPAGTYTLTITGTTQGTSRTLNLTLTVDASD